MSTLVFELLETELTQEIAIGHHLGVYSPKIVPWLYFVNNPAGTFTLSIYKGVNILASRSFTVVDLKAQLNTTDNSGHVWYRLGFEGVKLPFGFYTLKLTSSGYTGSTTSALCWCKDWDAALHQNPDLSGEVWTNYPLAVRIISLTSKEV